jgi:hypothetical protein
VAFLRLTRDHRGYENTYLLHAPQPGARPIVLYWYRSAPGVRIGRPALDEDAIRTIEEQHPHIDFDWPHILEVGAISEPEVERRPVRQKRRQGPPAKAGAPGAIPHARGRQPEEPVPTAGEGAPQELEAGDDGALIQAALESALASETEALLDEQVADEADEAPPRAHDLLEELVGHEIATRLHARYSEIISRVHRIPDDHPQRTAWQARAESLNPDNWVTPDEVLRGVSHADASFDALRKELLSH